MNKRQKFVHNSIATKLGSKIKLGSKLNVD